MEVALLQGVSVVKRSSDKYIMLVVGSEGAIVVTVTEIKHGLALSHDGNHQLYSKCPLVMDDASQLV